MQAVLHKAIQRIEREKQFHYYDLGNSVIFARKMHKDQKVLSVVKIKIYLDHPNPPETGPQQEPMST